METELVGPRQGYSAPMTRGRRAGAAPLAAARTLAGRLRGKTVVCVMSGGNLDSATPAPILRVVP